MAREPLNVKKVVVLYVILPTIALFMAWLWVKNERGALKTRGTNACIATRHDEEWCRKKADENHERCVELTFRPSSRTSRESFDAIGYVECIEVGDKEYWRRESERAAERRANEVPTIPTGPYYH